MWFAVPSGFCFGVVEISMPAFAEEHGAAAWAGVLLSAWAAASAVGGLAYGARNWRRPLPDLYLRLALLLPLGFLPALLAPSVALMALLIVPAGLLIAPLGAAGNQLVGNLAPTGTATEAYAWPRDGDDRRLLGRHRTGRHAGRGGGLAGVLRRGIVRRRGRCRAGPRPAIDAHPEPEAGLTRFRSAAVIFVRWRTRL
jgi:hypothetical protein